MGCEEIKKIIPQYFKLTASEENMKIVEEHLCSCHDCRTALGELMDKASDQSVQSAETDPQPESASSEEPEGVTQQNSPQTAQENYPKEETMEYFPGKDTEKLAKENPPKDELKLAESSSVQPQEISESQPLQDETESPVKEELPTEEPPMELEKELLIKKNTPQENKINFIEYVSLAIGILVLIFFIYLLKKG